MMKDIKYAECWDCDNIGIKELCNNCLHNLPTNYKNGDN